MTIAARGAKELVRRGLPFLAIRSLLKGVGGTFGLRNLFQSLEEALSAGKRGMSDLSAFGSLRGKDTSDLAVLP
jgi:hypothetical protein